MKVSVRNLGVIEEEATLDLKPLTVLIGPNNEGKTWLAYSVAGILGSVGSSAYAQAYSDKKVSNTYKQLDEAIEDVLSVGNATIDLRKLAEEESEKYFNDVALYARNWIGRFLGTRLARFDAMNISFTLEETKTGFLESIARYSRTSRVAGSTLTIRKSQRDEKVFVFTSSDIQGVEEQEEQLAERIPLEEVRERIVSFVSQALHQSLYPQVRIFPTERTTLVATRFGERILNSSSLNERVKDALDVLVQELDIKELANASREASGAVSVFLSTLRSIFKVRSRDRELREKQAERNPLIKRYMELANVLEDQILSGNVYLSTPEPDPSREVLFQPRQNVDLEIPAASSMVKELSPLALYLRYLAKPGELLVIDEPEMNLHPAAQVKIIEFLAMLANAGLHVLITTHSSYVVDHLVNLMEAQKHQNQDEIVEMFLLAQKEAFIDQEKVSVYLVEDGKVKNVLSPEGAIDWETFSEVSQLVGRIHFELLGE